MNDLPPEEMPMCKYCGPSSLTPQKNFIRAVSFLLALLVGGFPLFLEAATGGVAEQVQEAIHDEMDGEGIVTAIDHAMHWFETVSWSMRIFVALFMLLLIHFWRGGSITFKGVGLRGRRHRG